MADGSYDISASPADERLAAAASADDAHREARQQFAARRAYKRALRRARNPLYFSVRSLILVVAIALLACAAIFALAFALRDRTAPEKIAPVIEVAGAAAGAAIADESPAPQATDLPQVQVILAAETPAVMVLEGPAIPTVIITNTPMPLSVGVKAAVYGVGNDKLNIRNRPSLSDSQVLFREGEGKTFDIIGGPQEADGFSWWQVRDPQFQVEGWAVANYLRAISAADANEQ